jgi:hypothetical protein
MQKLFDFSVDRFVEVECYFEFRVGVRIVHLVGREAQNVAHKEEIK